MEIRMGLHLSILSLIFLFGKLSPCYAEWSLVENETTVERQATSAWFGEPQEEWFRLMPSAADMATGVVHALLNADYNKIYVPFNDESSSGISSLSPAAAVFARECNEAIHTALLNQGLQLMPPQVADAVIVFDYEATSAVEAVVNWRNRSVSFSDSLATLPVVVMTPLSVSREWGLWSVGEELAPLDGESLTLFTSGPVYHASAFSTPTFGYWETESAINISASFVNASMTNISAVAEELQARIMLDNRVSAAVEWMSMTVGPVGWSDIGFCGQGLRQVYLPEIIWESGWGTRSWEPSGGLMEGSTAVLGSCGAPRVLPPHYRGVSLLYSGIVDADLPKALREAMHGMSIHERQIHVQFVEDGYNLMVTAENVNRGIASHPPVLGIAGIYGTPTAAAALTAITSYSQSQNVGDIPMFGAMTGSPDMRHPYRRNIINIRASMADEAYAMVNALQEWGRLEVAMFYLSTSFGTQGVSAVNASLMAAGGALLHAEGTANGAEEGEYRAAVDKLHASLSGEIPLAFVLWHADQAVLSLTALIRERYGKEPLIMVTSTGGGIAAMNGLQGNLGHNVFFARVVAPQHGAARSNWLTQEGYLTASIIRQAARTAFDEEEEAYSVVEGESQHPLTRMQALAVVDGVATDPFEAETREILELLRREMIDAVYFHKYFSSPHLLESDILGPYSSSCNQGTQKLYITGIDDVGSDVVFYRSPSLECTGSEFSSTWDLLLGVTVPLTGERRQEAIEIVHGLEAAVMAVGSEAVVPGFSLELAVLDDGGEPSSMIENMHTLVNNFSVAALLAPLGENAVNNMIPAAENLSLPLFGALSGSQHLRHPYNPLFVNIRAGIQDEVQLMINHAMQASNTRIALIYTMDALGNHVRKSLEISLANQGLRIHALVVYDPDSDSSASLVAKLQKASGLTPPQALLTVTHEELSAGIVHAIRDLWPLAGVSVYSLASLHAENYLKLLGENTDSVYLTGMVPDPRGNTEVATAYRHYLQQSCGSSCEPSFEGLEAFVALMALAQTMKNVDPMVLRSLNQPLTTSGTKAENRRILAQNCVHNRPPHSLRYPLGAIWSSM